ncbi:MAG: type II toxin-antitoxin system RelE/ParE family toxin [Bacteroidetes bacterium]|nr:type II toxin-antitoxin system RelE/ParE family toxin [Bacteroidota bacterium]MBU1720069.1 type II toxin-antitoxin system RelE/ParE family toxin [Bacteroidota bacterium]
MDAFLWYESQREGLGFDFELCLEAAINKILRNPLLFEVRHLAFHVCFIDRFPYGIHYCIDEKTIRVLGVFHTRRNPKRWTARMKNRG